MEALTRLSRYEGPARALPSRPQFPVLPPLLSFPQEEIEQCVSLIVAELTRRGINNPWRLAYQSRVGPVEWLKPYTDATIREMGSDGVHALVAVPISFVSEHIETLEEIDCEYRELAEESGIHGWARVPALGVNETFIDDLADAVLEALPFVGSVAQAQAAGQYQSGGLDPLVRQLGNWGGDSAVVCLSLMLRGCAPGSARLCRACVPCLVPRGSFRSRIRPELKLTLGRPSPAGSGPAWERRGPPRHVRPEAPRDPLSHRHLAVGVDALRGDLERALRDDGDARAAGVGGDHGEGDPAPAGDHPARVVRVGRGGAGGRGILRFGGGGLGPGFWGGASRWLLRRRDGGTFRRLRGARAVILVEGGRARPAGIERGAARSCGRPGMRADAHKCPAATACKQQQHGNRRVRLIGASQGGGGQGGQPLFCRLLLVGGVRNIYRSFIDRHLRLFEVGDS